MADWYQRPKGSFGPGRGVTKSTEQLRNDISRRLNRMAKSIEQHRIEAEQRSKAFMETPDQWPMYPFLPVKNKKKREAGGMPTCGFMHANIKSTVFLKGIYELKPGPLDLRTLPKEEFADLDALLVAGWEVD